MSAMVLLIAAGGLVVLGFLGAFIWAVRSGQFDDTGTPPVRLLVDDRDDRRPSSSQSRSTTQVGAGLVPARRSTHEQSGSR